MSGGVSGYLFGKAPSVVQEPAPAAAPAITSQQQLTQNSVSGLLNALLQSGGGYPGTSYTGAGPQAQYAAGITPQQQSLIDSIVGAQTGQVGQTQGNAMSVLSGVLNSQPISWQQAFQSIAQPLQQQFSQSTLPAIEAAAGTSAGGKMQGGNTGINYAVDQATNQLTQNEANAASSLQYQSSQANVQNILSALGLTPQVTGAPAATGLNALQAATLPQQTEQTQLTGQYNAYQNAMQSFLQLLGVGSGFSTSTDVAFPQGNTVVNPGMQGLVNQLLVAVAGSAGKMAAA